MSNEPPENRPHRLRDDEPIALLVAFLAFGGILAWGLNQGRAGFDLSSFWKGAAGTSSPSPLVQVSPDAGNADTSGSASPQPADAATNSNGSLTSPVGARRVEPPAESGTGVTAPVVPAPTVSTPTAPESPSISASPSVSPAPSVSAAPASPGTPINFPDVPKDSPTYTYVSRLSALGILSGFPDGTFKPDQPVTRAEYASQLQKAFSKPDRLPVKRFSDVAANHWSATAIDKAVKSNFMSGYSEDNSFRPDKQITRTEAIVALMQGLGIPATADPDAALQAYPDQAQVPKWARSRVATALQSSIFVPDAASKTLTPSQPATRADIAALIYKGLEVSKGQKP